MHLSHLIKSNHVWGRRLIRPDFGNGTTEDSDHTLIYWPFLFLHSNCKTVARKENDVSAVCSVASWKSKKNRRCASSAARYFHFVFWSCWLSVCPELTSALDIHVSMRFSYFFFFSVFKKTKDQTNSKVEKKKRKEKKTVGGWKRNKMRVRFFSCSFGYPLLNSMDISDCVCVWVEHHTCL